jgi:hypothetical protein
MMVTPLNIFCFIAFIYSVIPGHRGSDESGISIVALIARYALVYPWFAYAYSRSRNLEISGSARRAAPE